MTENTTTTEYGNIRDLIQCCYEELKRQSGRKMAFERKNHSWTETVLVNELVEKLLRTEAPIPLDENEFYRFASTAMSNLLSEHARRRTAQKRRYDKREFLELQHVIDELSPYTLTGEQWIDLQQILDELSQKIPRAVKVFNMRLQGFTNKEAAEIHSISEPQASADYKRVISHLIMRLDSNDEYGEDTQDSPDDEQMKFGSNDDDGEGTPDDESKSDN